MVLAVETNTARKGGHGKIGMEAQRTWRGAIGTSAVNGKDATEAVE
jgi:hypothetical protein